MVPAGFCLTQGRMIFSSSRTWYTPQKTCQEKEMRSDGCVHSIGEGWNIKKYLNEVAIVTTFFGDLIARLSIIFVNHKVLRELSLNNQMSENKYLAYLGHFLTLILFCWITHFLSWKINKRKKVVGSYKYSKSLNCFSFRKIYFETNKNICN